MDRRTVQLSIGGQSYKLVSSAPEAELRRLADTVEAKLSEVVPPGKALPPQALLLVAMGLAHDLELERTQRKTLERRSRDMLRRVLVRIDDALDGGEPE